MPGNGPQTGLDELPLVGGVSPESRLLPVRRDLEEEPQCPHGPADVVSQPQWSDTLGLVDHQSGQQSYKDPQTLQGPCHKEPGRCLLDFVEPRVFSVLHDP